MLCWPEFRRQKTTNCVQRHAPNKPQQQQQPHIFSADPDAHTHAHAHTLPCNTPRRFDTPRSNNIMVCNYYAQRMGQPRWKPGGGLGRAGEKVHDWRPGGVSQL
jgi:hypothetical protein